MTDTAMTPERLEEIEAAIIRGSSDVHWRANIWCGELIAAYRALQARERALREVLESAQGYLLNAKIDLETGAPKATALQTINGGLRMIDDARAALTPKD